MIFNRIYTTDIGTDIKRRKKLEKKRKKKELIHGIHNRLNIVRL